MSQVTIAISVVICIAAWRRVTAPAIEHGQDTWKQSGGNHGMAFAGPMNKIESVIA